MHYITKSFALAISMLVLAGCAAPAAQEDRLAEIQRLAEQALEEARAAAGQATNALSVASEASFAATQAQNAAESALSCCQENRDKIDRGFQDRMRK